MDTALNRFTELCDKVFERYPEFNKLKVDKQERIVSAAVREFAVHGFRNASTNAIVKDAGIGKGMLFRYFKSKKDLYVYCCYRVIKKTMTEVTEQFGKTPGIYKDFSMESLLKTSLMKLSYVRQHPLESQLMVSALTNVPDELKDVLGVLAGLTYDSSYEIFFTMLDRSKFRAGVNPEAVKNVLKYIFEGFQKKISTMNFDVLDESFESVYHEFEVEILEYMDILKNGIYEKP